MGEDAVVETLGWPWALVALCACAAIVACAIWHRRKIKPASFAWAIPFAGVTAFFAVWCASGLCRIEAVPFCECQLLCGLLGIGVLHREQITEAAFRSAANRWQRGGDTYNDSPDAVALCAQKEAPEEGGAYGSATGGVNPDREASASWTEALKERMLKALPWIRDFVLIAIAAWFSFVALEIADNPDWVAIDPSLRNREVFVLALTIACLYFLGQRRGVLCVIVPVVCALFGLVQTFLDLFKNTALLPSDVMAWQTAAAVSGGYTYVLPTLAIESIVSATVALAALAFIVPAQNAAAEKPLRSRLGRMGRVGINLGLCVLCAFGVYANTLAIDYRNDLGVKLDYWDLRNSYHASGFFSSFIAACQALSVDAPEGYSDEAALQLQKELANRYDEQFASERKAANAQFEQLQPSVIAIMNESYADLSVFEELHDGYTGTYVTESLDGCEVKGDLAMSVHGGGTCNSEYEFLAFSSMAFMGGGMYPYQQFSFAHAKTLPSVFKKLGYSTWAMHPSYPGNWSREFVYADMGIDTSLFIYDFDGADQFHGQVSDRATYDRALDILKDNDGAQFILDITMQNHSGYDRGNIPADQVVQVHPDFLDESETLVLDEFLSCIKSSDEAIEYLIEQLRALDEPVAVVFFGDHQPSMTRDFNDILFQGESELVHKARITEVPYFVWTNYDVAASAAGDMAESGVDAVAAEESVASDAVADEADAVASAPDSALRAASLSSANYLGAQLLEAIGAPLDDYQKALLALHQQVLAVNTNGFCDDQGVWHDASEGEAPDHPYHQLQMLHYLNVVRNL